MEIISALYSGIPKNNIAIKKIKYFSYFLCNYFMVIIYLTDMLVMSDMLVMLVMLSGPGE